MPGVTGAFLCSGDGIIATSLSEVAPQKRAGRTFLNILSGAFSLGHFIQEIYCSFNNSTLMIRPASRGCILAAICKPGVATRLVDISLTMTVKSIEEELNDLDELPRPLKGMEAEIPETEDGRGSATGDRESGDSEVQDVVETKA